MKLTICEFTGNFTSGASSDAIDATNIEQSICNYKTEVERILTSFSPEMEIAWDIRNGEGDPSRYHVVEFNSDDDDDGPEKAQEENDIRFSIDAVRERVFSQGAFWVTADA